MKMLFLILVAIVALSPATLAQGVRLERAYVATHGHINEFLIAPSGQIVPVGYKGLPKNFSSWRLRSSVSVPTLKQAGTIQVTPNEKYLYVAGCASDPTQIVHGEHPVLEEIAPYVIIGGVPRPIGQATKMEDCLTGNDPPYQTFAISRDGNYLFATGGVVDHDDAPEMTTVRSFRIAQNGTLIPISTESLLGSPISSFTGLDSTGKWLFVAGIVKRYKAPLTLVEFHVASDGSLSKMSTTSFDGELDSFSGMALATREPLLYLDGDKFSDTAARTKVFGYHIGPDGELTPATSVITTGLVGTPSIGFQSLLMAPSERLLYVLGALNSQVFDSQTRGPLIQAYAIDSKGQLRLSPGSTATTNHVADPQMIALSTTGKYIYEMDQHAGFMGGPAIVEFTASPSGAITFNANQCLGGGPVVAICGRLPTDTGPIVIIK